MYVHCIVGEGVTGTRNTNSKRIQRKHTEINVFINTVRKTIVYMYADLNIFTKRWVLMGWTNRTLITKNRLIFRNLYSKLSIFLPEQEI